MKTAATSGVAQYFPHTLGLEVNSHLNSGSLLAKDSNSEWGAVEGEESGVLTKLLFVGLSHYKIM